MIPLEHSIHIHSTLWAMGAYIVCSNAVNALVPPTDKSGNFYKWFFGFSHGLILQVGRFVNKNGNGNNGNQENKGA